MGTFPMMIPREAFLLELVVKSVTIHISNKCSFPHQTRCSNDYEILPYPIRLESAMINGWKHALKSGKAGLYQTITARYHTTWSRLTNRNETISISALRLMSRALQLALEAFISRWWQRLAKLTDTQRRN